MPLLSGWLFNRDCTVLALGGGVIGRHGWICMGMFPAWCVLLLQVPTTLLSQVDSSVGGKTGIKPSFG